MPDSAAKKAANKRYYEKNKEKVRAINAAWARKNPEKMLAYKKAWRKKNPPTAEQNHAAYLKRKEYYAAWYKANREEIKKRHTAYRKANLEKMRIYAKRHAQKYPEKVAERLRRWKSENPLSLKTYGRARREKEGQSMKAYMLAVKHAFANFSVCYNCGVDTRLQVDHHYPLSAGHRLTPQNAVLLCKKCNLKKSNKDPRQFYLPSQNALLYVLHEIKHEIK